MKFNDDDEVEQELNEYGERDPAVRSFLRRALRTRKDYLRNLELKRAGVVRVVKSSTLDFSFVKTEAADEIARAQRINAVLIEQARTAVIQAEHNVWRTIGGGW